MVMNWFSSQTSYTKCYVVDQCEAIFYTLFRPLLVSVGRNYNLKQVSVACALLEKVSLFQDYFGFLPRQSSYFIER